MRQLLAIILATTCIGLVPPGAVAESPDSFALRPWESKGATDRLRANAHSTHEGSVIRLFRKEDDVWVRVDEKLANWKGNALFEIDDADRRATTRYRAVLHPADPEYPYGTRVAKTRVR